MVSPTDLVGSFCQDGDARYSSARVASAPLTLPQIAVRRARRPAEIKPVVGDCGADENHDMEIAEPDVGSDETVAAMHEVHRAAAAEDRPELPGPCPYAFRVDIRGSRPGSRSVRRVAVVDGRIVGSLSVGLPTIDNLHLAGVDVAVHPDFRRRGVGRRLLETGVDLARAEGRRTITATALATVPGGVERSAAGRTLLESLGFTAALTELWRITDITALDPAEEQRLYDQARKKAGDYELHAWAGPVSDDLIEDVAAMNSSFLTEAPTGDLDIEDEKIDAQRVRDTDAAALARGLAIWGVIARHSSSGQPAAITMIGKTKEPPDHASQWITLVHPAHRGHRLGLLTKLENHRQVRRDAPQVRWLSTANADVNSYMITINEQLGYRLLDGTTDYQLKL